MATGEKSVRTRDTRSSESSTALARRTSAGQVLPKDVFDLAEDAAVVLVFALLRLYLLLGQRRGQLFEQLLLFLRQFLRRDGLDGHEQVAAAAARHVRHALAAQAERCSGLRALGNLERLVAVNARQLDLGAERERRKRER